LRVGGEVNASEGLEKRGMGKKSEWGKKKGSIGLHERCM